MSNQQLPVGVFDSGVGGFSILREIHRQLPGEDVVYIADQEWAPYGSRSLEAVRARSVAIVAELIGRGCKAVVVACNSASAAALHYLREVFPATPFVGMEPAIKPAAADSATGVIGVLATATTFQGELYASVINRHAAGTEVHEVASDRLAMLVEQGDHAEAKAELELVLRPLLAANVDTLVLGCTHYPFLEDEIRSVVGPSVRVVDPAPAIGRQLRRVLQELNLGNGQATGSTVYFTTLDPGNLEEQAARLLGRSINATTVEIENQGLR